MTATFLLNIAVLTLTLALAMALLRLRRHEHALRWQDMQIRVLRERIGVTDGDVEKHHALIHPECVEGGQR